MMQIIDVQAIITKGDGLKEDEGEEDKKNEKRNRKEKEKKENKQAKDSRGSVFTLNWFTLFIFARL